MRVLIVEDDELLADGIITNLQMNGYTADWVDNGEQAVHAIESESFDVVILDLGLPGIDGMEVLRRIRDARNNTPVLILSARDQLESRVKGLDHGADDYLLKPFDVLELNARLRALMRRVGGDRQPDIEWGDIKISPAEHKVYKSDCEIKLSPREYTLLHELGINRHRIMSKEQLESSLYGWTDDIGSNALEVHIHNLRKKLGNNIVKTIRGVGYSIGKE